MEFITTHIKPNDMCDEAWNAIHQCVFSIHHGEATFFKGEWMNRPDVAICSCNDGLRPVIFKLEAVKE